MTDDYIPNNPASRLDALLRAVTSSTKHEVSIWAATVAALDANATRLASQKDRTDWPYVVVAAIHAEVKALEDACIQNGIRTKHYVGMLRHLRKEFAFDRIIGPWKGAAPSIELLVSIKLPMLADMLPDEPRPTNDDLAALTDRLSEFELSLEGCNLSPSLRVVLEHLISQLSDALSLASLTGLRPFSEAVRQLVGLAIEYRDELEQDRPPVQALKQVADATIQVIKGAAVAEGATAAIERAADVIKKALSWNG